ncbi:hypothetical protein B0H14DRAFT_2629077 [Mycena olivaceomarginata]|nr:hypothetical protein B0H14DRAFT_2629077 [Mycena olivaceomarginata]
MDLALAWGHRRMILEASLPTAGRQLIATCVVHVEFGWRLPVRPLAGTIRTIKRQIWAACSGVQDAVDVLQTTTGVKIKISRGMHAKPDLEHLLPTVSTFLTNRVHIFDQQGSHLLPTVCFTSCSNRSHFYEGDERRIDTDDYLDSSDDESGSTIPLVAQISEVSEEESVCRQWEENNRIHKRPSDFTSPYSCPHDQKIAPGHPRGRTAPKSVLRLAGGEAVDPPYKRERIRRTQRAPHALGEVDVDPREPVRRRQAMRSTGERVSAEGSEKEGNARTRRARRRRRAASRRDTRADIRDEGRAGACFERRACQKEGKERCEVGRLREARRARKGGGAEGCESGEVLSGVRRTRRREEGGRTYFAGGPSRAGERPAALCDRTAQIRRWGQAASGEQQTQFEDISCKLGVLREGCEQLCAPSILRTR